MVKHISVELVKEKTQKIKSGTVESIRKSLINSLDRELSQQNRSSVITKGNNGETFVILKYGYLIVDCFEIDEQNIEKELLDIKSLVASKKEDGAIETFMKTPEYNQYISRLSNMRKSK